MHTDDLLFLVGLTIVWLAGGLFVARDLIGCFCFVRDYQPLVYTCQTRQEAGWQESKDSEPVPTSVAVAA
jgi:hypothetical protein